MICLNLENSRAFSLKIKYISLIITFAMVEGFFILLNIQYVNCMVSDFSNRSYLYKEYQNKKHTKAEKPKNTRITSPCYLVESWWVYTVYTLHNPWYVLQHCLSNNDETFEFVKKWAVVGSSIVGKKHCVQTLFFCIVRLLYQKNINILGFMNFE